jgi:hypothetical protein
VDNDKRRERRKSRRDNVIPLDTLNPAYSTTTLEIDMDHVGRDHQDDDLDGYDMVHQDNYGRQPPAYAQLDQNGFRRGTCVRFT